MSKNAYDKDQVWGTIGFIAFIVILGLFIGREMAQDRQIKLLTESNLQLIESRDALYERLNNFDFVSEDEYKRDKETLENKIEGAWNSTTSAHTSIYELDEKLGDRIPNWNKR